MTERHDSGQHPHVPTRPVVRRQLPDIRYEDLPPEVVRHHQGPGARLLRRRSGRLRRGRGRRDAGPGARVGRRSAEQHPPLGRQGAGAERRSGERHHGPLARLRRRPRGRHHAPGRGRHPHGAGDERVRRRGRAAASSSPPWPWAPTSSAAGPGDAAGREHPPVRVAPHHPLRLHDRGRRGRASAGPRRRTA